MKKLLCLLSVILFFSISSYGTTWFVDGTATGSHNGTSWANAWTTMSEITGVNGGDIVYISGGSSGNSQTYNIGSGLSLISGTSGHVVTYQIGQDSAHNGTAIFSGNSGGTFLINNFNNISIIGDAGDGKMHFSTTGCAVIMSYNSTALSNLRIGYINFGQMAGTGGQNGNVMNVIPINGFEFDHNYVYASALDANAFAFIRCNGTTWDQNKIHDNEIHLPHKTGDTGTGADGIETGGTEGVSFYNNLMVAFSIAYTGGQHQDAWQDTGGSSYIKIYNNFFVNFGNYCVYGDATFGDFTHFWIYNNICVVSDIQVTQGSPGAIVIGVDGGYTNSTATFTDVAIINNITDSYLANQGISLNNYTTHGGVFNGCLIANNISLNGGGIDTNKNTTTPSYDNVSLTVSQGQAAFISYNSLTTNNDYHLLTNPNSLLIAKGINESSYFTIDYSQNPRQSSGPWDIGVYVYSSSGGGGTYTNLAHARIHF